MKSKIVVLVGESCSGKDHIAKRLIYKYDWHFAISYTTRPKRENETDGVEYFFIDNVEFDEKFNKEELFEKTIYTPDGQKWQYGLGRNSFIDDNINVVIVNPHGLKQLMESDIKDRLMVFKIKCNLEERIKRYLDRDTVTDNIKVQMVDRILEDIKDFNGFVRKYNNIREIINDGYHSINYLCEDIKTQVDDPNIFLGRRY